MFYCIDVVEEFTFVGYFITTKVSSTYHKHRLGILEDLLSALDSKLSTKRFGTMALMDDPIAVPSICS